MAGETEETCFDEYVAAREQFEKLMGELRSESARSLEHGEAESLIAREGNELMRRLMQGYLDQRTATEERCEGVTGADGDLREATRKKAEATTYKLKARLSKGEKRNSKRMATVASVGSSSSQ